MVSVGEPVGVEHGEGPLDDVGAVVAHAAPSRPVGDRVDGVRSATLT